MNTELLEATCPKTSEFVPDSDRNLVSIVIPAYNSAKTLRHTLPSILSQEQDYIADIIVVDSSDDGLMPDLIAEFETKGVRFVNSGIRVQPATQRNIGAREAKGSVLVFFDADVILEDGYIEKLVGHYREGYKVGFGSVALPPFQRRKLVALSQYYLQLNEYLPVGSPQEKPYVIGCSNYMEKELFDRIGGYPDLRAAEDVILGMRLREFTPIYFFPDMTVDHIFRESWKGFFRYEIVLGKFVARYKRTETESIAFRGILPVVLFPLFLAFKCYKIFPRLIKAGPKHIARSLLIMPFFMVGLFYWGIGFLKEALNKDKFTY